MLCFLHVDWLVRLLSHVGTSFLSALSALYGNESGESISEREANDMYCIRRSAVARERKNESASLWMTISSTDVVGRLVSWLHLDGDNQKQMRDVRLTGAEY